MVLWQILQLYDSSGPSPSAVGSIETEHASGATIGTYGVSKLQNGDTGFYLGEDGLLHMLPERVVSDGANITICYLPTTILDGKVTSYREVKVVNGIIYPVDSEGVNTNAYAHCHP